MPSDRPAPGDAGAHAQRRDPPATPSERTEPGDASAASGGDVHRLHPLSLVFRVAASVKLLLVPLLLVFVAGGESREPWWLGLFVLPGLMHSVFHYMTYRYRFAGDELVVRGGLVFRSERHIPYARIHNIDMTQGPFHRLFRVADVRIETAGGAEPEARLQVLSLAAVDRMRARVFRAARADAARDDGARDDAGRDREAGVHEQERHDVGARDAALRDGALQAGTQHDDRQRLGPPAPQRLLRLRARDLLLFGLISNRGMAVVLAALGLGHEFDIFERVHLAERLEEAALPEVEGWLAGAALGLGVVLVVVIALRLLSIVWAVLYLGGFELEREGDDLRSRAGLITRVSATIPRHRIQVVTITETLLHRVFGRVAVKVDTAGGDSLERASQSTRRWLAPLLRRDELDDLLDEVQPGLRLAKVEWSSVHPRAERRLARRWAVLAGLGAVGLGAFVLLREGSPGDLSGPDLGVRAGLVVLAAVAIALLGRLDARVRARRLQWSLDQHAVWTRRGVWTRTTRVVRDRKAQVVALGSTPFDRRWGMARITVDAAGSDEPVSQGYLTTVQAEQVLDALTRRVAHTAFHW